MTYTFDENVVSDLHKDAYGFRPSESFWREWEELDDAGRQEIWDGLLESLEAEVAYVKERERKAIAKFEGRVADLMLMGARDRAMAIRWLHEAEGSDGTSNHLEYLLGLPFGYFSN